MGEIKEGMPAVSKACFWCKKESLYTLRNISKYGEAVCPECGRVFWAASLMDFKRTFGEKFQALETSPGGEG